jgi:hypothetical protein
VAAPPVTCRRLAASLTASVGRGAGDPALRRVSTAEGSPTTALALVPTTSRASVRVGVAAGAAPTVTVTTFWRSPGPKVTVVASGA